MVFMVYLLFIPYREFSKASPLLCPPCAIRLCPEHLSKQTQPVWAEAFTRFDAAPLY